MKAVKRTENIMVGQRERMYTCTLMKQETNEELHVQGTYKVTDGPKECSVIPYKKKNNSTYNSINTRKGKQRKQHH